MVLYLFIACEVELAGVVHDEDGAPVGGAVLDAEVCDAVSAADGTFRVRCPRGLHHFLVTHPTHAATALDVDATELFAPPPSEATLRAWPTVPGLYAEPGLERLGPTPLVRTVAAAEQRFCLPEGTALPALVPPAAMLDVHSFDWRLYPLDTAGCALILHTTDGRYWQPNATGVDVPHTELAPGYRHVRPELAAGRYVAVSWHDGFLVPLDPKADTWEAWAFEVR